MNTTNIAAVPEDVKPILRDYQEEAVRKCLNAIASGMKSPLISLPTGAGKSLVLAELSRRFRENGKKILILTHSRELVKQDHSALKSLGVKASILTAGIGKDLSAVTVGTVQTSASKRNLERVRDYGFDILIVDEAHRVNLTRAGTIYSRIFSCIPIQIGLTATPYRHGKSALVGEGVPHAFQEIVHDVRIEELIEKDYLAPLLCKIPDTIDTQNIKKNQSTQDFETRSLSDAAIALVDKHVPQAVHILKEMERRKTLFFCVSQAHSRLVKAELEKYGVESFFVSHETPKKERNEMLEHFRKSRDEIAMVNCEILTTGFDVPDLDSLVLFRPTLSKVLYTQMIGRGTRKSEGKADCLMLDYGGNILRFGLYPDAYSKLHAWKLCEGEDCMNFVTSDIKYCSECSPPDDEEHEAGFSPDLDVLELYSGEAHENFIFRESGLTLYAYIHTSKAGNLCLVLCFRRQNGKSAHRQYYVIQNKWNVEKMFIELKKFGIIKGFGMLDCKYTAREENITQGIFERLAQAISWEAKRKVFSITVNKKHRFPSLVNVKVQEEF
jgi:DNA repair protein RadD